MKMDKDFIKSRKAVIKELSKLETRFGVDVARSAMRKHLQVEGLRNLRTKQIAKLQAEISQLSR